MLSQQEKESIFHKLVQGDTIEKNSAIQSIYEEFHPVLYKKLRYLYRDLSENETQDIVQDSFLKILTTTSKPQSPESLVSWVITISQNTALDLFRRAYKKYEIPLPDGVDVTDEVEASDAKNQAIKGGSAVSADFDIQDCVSTGLILFSQKFPHNGFAISMHLDGVSIIDIALLISRTEGATKQYIYESKKKFAPYIEHCLAS